MMSRSTSRQPESSSVINMEKRSSRVVAIVMQPTSLLPSAHVGRDQRDDHGVFRSGTSQREQITYRPIS